MRKLVSGGNKKHKIIESNARFVDDYRLVRE